jgi:adenosylhomocysteinase
MFDPKDKKLIDQGRKNLDFAEGNMSALMKLRERFKKQQTFKGIKIGMALHITKETGVLVRTLIDGGAKVAVTSCNPLSAQDDIVAALMAEGVDAHGYKGESRSDYYKFLNKIIAMKPDITVDDGCDLVTEIHTKHPHLIKNIIGGCEETTTGILRLHSMVKAKQLKYPVVAVNDNNTKHLMDNYYGTGQSTLDGVIRASNILFAGKNVVVAGYGDCGKGVAMRARGLGSIVIVTEVRPFRALQARMDGFEVMPMNEAAKIGDIFMTVTGDIDVLTPAHFKLMKTGAILANSGHFDCEIDVAALDKMSVKKRRIRPFLDEYTLKNGKKTKCLYVAGEGRLVNLAAAEGHPSEVMSMSFCGQALAVEYLLKNKGKLVPGIYKLPDALDESIAQLQLDSMGIKIDKLTAKQNSYLNSWEEGT